MKKCMCELCKELLLSHHLQPIAFESNGALRRLGHLRICGRLVIGKKISSHISNNHFHDTVNVH